MKYLKLIIILTIIASLAIFVNATDFKKVFTSIQAIGSQFIILILVTFLSSILGTLSWHSCLGNHASSVSLNQLFLIRHVGETASLFNPAGIVGGDAIKVHLLRSQDIERKTVLASILVSRAIMIFTQLFLFSIAATILFIRFLTWNQIAQYVEYLLLTGAGLILLIILISSSKPIKVWFINMPLGRAIQARTSPYRKKLNELHSEMYSFYKRNKKSAAYATFFASLHWIVGAMEFYFILSFLGINVSILQALLVDMGVIFFKTAGIFIPAQAGIEEYGNKIMLAAIGISGAEIWITVSILRRARQLFWLVFGIGVYSLMYKSWNHRLQQADGNTVR